MNKQIAVVAVLAALNGFGNDATTANQPLKVLPVHPSKMAEYNAKTGGLVEPPANAKHLLFLDARATDVPELAKFTSAAEQRLVLGIDVKRISLDAKDSPRELAFNAKKAGAGAVVILYDRAGEPTLNVFPEDGIVLVNFAPLRCDDKNKFSRRFATEFWRSICFALGGYSNTVQMGSSMQGIFSLKDFESLRGAGLGPNEVTAINVNKAKLGICGRTAVPYSRACREGWAPAPTNDVQRSFYNRFMGGPTSQFDTDFKK